MTALSAARTPEQSREYLNNVPHPYEWSATSATNTHTTSLDGTPSENIFETHQQVLVKQVDDMTVEDDGSAQLGGDVCSGADVKVRLRSG